MSGSEMMNGHGYGWEYYNLEIKSGTIINYSITLGKLLVTVKNADGSPCLGQRIRVYEQGQDSTGQPTLITTYTSGDGSTNSQGIVEFDLTPGIYGIKIGDKIIFNAIIESGKITQSDGIDTLPISDGEPTVKIETAPPAPSNLVASPISSSKVSLSWVDNSDNEDGFKIERKETGGSYSEIKTLPANTTSYSDTGLISNHTYSYKISAFNSYGYSSYSNEISVKTASVENKTTTNNSATSLNAINIIASYVKTNEPKILQRTVYYSIKDWPNNVYSFALVNIEDLPILGDKSLISKTLSVLGLAKKGEILKFLKSEKVIELSNPLGWEGVDNGIWYQVELPNGEIGWIFAKPDDQQGEFVSFIDNRPESVKQQERAAQEAAAKKAQAEQDSETKKAVWSFIGLAAFFLFCKALPSLLGQSGGISFSGGGSSGEVRHEKRTHIFGPDEEVEVVYDKDGDKVAEIKHEKQTRIFGPDKEVDIAYDKNGNRIGKIEHDEEIRLLGPNEKVHTIYDDKGNKIGKMKDKEDFRIFGENEKYKNIYDSNENKIGEVRHEKETRFLSPDEDVDKVYGKGYPGLDKDNKDNDENEDKG